MALSKMVEFLTENNKIAKTFHSFSETVTDLLKVACRVKTNQLEQHKTELPLIILAKHLKPILFRVIKGT